MTWNINKSVDADFAPLEPDEWAEVLRRGRFKVGSKNCWIHSEDDGRPVDFIAYGRFFNNYNVKGKWIRVWTGETVLDRYGPDVPIQP